MTKPKVKGANKFIDKHFTDTTDGGKHLHDETNPNSLDTPEKVEVKGQLRGRKAIFNLDTEKWDSIGSSNVPYLEKDVKCPHCHAEYTFRFLGSSNVLELKRRLYEDIYRWGGDEDSEGNLCYGSIDFNDMCKKLVKKLLPYLTAEDELQDFAKWLYAPDIKYDYKGLIKKFRKETAGSKKGKK
jgi:hypothetical protein